MSTHDERVIQFRARHQKTATQRYELALARAARKEAKKALKQKTLSTAEQLLAIISDPTVAQIADAVPPPNPSGYGAPCSYPNLVWAILNAFTMVMGSQRAVVTYFANPKTGMWAHLRADIGRIHGEETMDSISPVPPGRSTWRHHNKRFLAVLPELHELVEEAALAQAQDQGCLVAEPGSTARVPDRADIVTGDGTVVASPIKQSTIDRVGNRYNTPSALFKEGGEEGGVDAFGCKFIFLSTRPDNLPLSRIILSVRRQDESRKGAEAGQAIDMLTALQQRSEGRVQAVCWDGAMRGVHAAALLNQGILPVRRHHKGTKPRRYIDPVGSLNLWTVTGGLVERKINVDGTPRDTPCPILKREKRHRGDGTYRWYNVYAVPSTGEVIRVPLHQSAHDTARRYNRCENLQPFAPGSSEYNKLYGYRGLRVRPCQPRPDTARETHDRLPPRHAGPRHAQLRPRSERRIALSARPPRDGSATRGLSRPPAPFGSDSREPRDDPPGRDAGAAVGRGPRTPWLPRAAAVPIVSDAAASIG